MGIESSIQQEFTVSSKLRLKGGFGQGSQCGAVRHPVAELHVFSGSLFVTAVVWAEVYGFDVGILDQGNGPVQRAVRAHSGVREALGSQQARASQIGRSGGKFLGNGHAQRTVGQADGQLEGGLSRGSELWQDG